METTLNKNDEKVYQLTENELYKLLAEAYRSGYSTYEMVEAGLERYDSDAYARWIIKGLK